MSYINPLLGGNMSLGGVQMALAAAYESRIHTFSKMSTPRAQFAGDTAVTLTDGSYNTRYVKGQNPNADIPASSTAQLANTSNSAGNGGKPLVIRPLRDPFTAEIYDYAVFNADGSFPGGVNPLVYDSATSRWNLNPAARYAVNKETAEIYLNAKGTGVLMEHFNPDGLVDTNPITAPPTPESQSDIVFTHLLPTGYATATAEEQLAMRKKLVVGLVDFEGLQGGALSAAQQQASELSGIIASLTSVLRTVNESKKTTLGLIR